MTQSGKAHTAEKPHPSVARGILHTAGVFGIAIILALTATGGSYALWRDSTDVDAPALTAGSTGLTINGVTDVTVGMTAARLYPGRSVTSTAPLTVKNTGTIPLSVTAATPAFSSSPSALASHLTVSLRPSASCTPGAAGIPPAALPASMGAVHLAPGAETQLCLEVYLSATAPSTVSGTTAAFTVRLDGAQVPRS